MQAADLPLAYVFTPLRGVLRSQPEDFFVDEQLGFMPDGVGEHLLVRVEKRQANTEWVARQLAGFAQVTASAVSFAGMKDRHAVTRQTFSIHLPGKPDPDWANFAHPEIRILEAARHSRKLKRGALTGNQFRIVLREVEGDSVAIEARIAALAAQGVPNYFGEQRFGRGWANLDQARAMFAGQRVPRHERSILLSAARSWLFNALLAERVRAGTWDQPVEGDVWMLHGSHAIFGPEPITEILAERLRTNDIHPTGALWGRGKLRCTGSVAELEQAVIQRDPVLADGLIAAGLEQERRALRLCPQALRSEWLDTQSLALDFFLPAGGYATSVLRELAELRNAAAIHQSRVRGLEDGSDEYRN